MAGTVGIALPPPYQGQNDRLPVIALQNPYCVNLENFKNVGGNLVLRNGNGLWAIKDPNAYLNCLSIVTYGDSTPIVMVDLGGGTGGYNWYDISSGGFVLMRTEAALSGNTWVETLYFNGYLFFMGDNNLSSAVGLEYYNGTAWGISAYTWPASFNPRGGCVFKNRAYFIGRDSSDYGYTEIDSISGTITKKSLGGIVNTKAFLYIIRSISSTENTTLDNVLCFVLANGDVLVYGGAYPDSDSWSIVSRLRISRPIGVNSYVDAKGDSFILTNSEILSLRNTIARGYTVEKLDGIGSTIQKRYAQIVGAFLADAAIGSDYRLWIKGIYDEAKDRLVISFPHYIDKTGTSDKTKAFQLIYDFTLNAWYEYVQNCSVVGEAIGITYYSNNVFFLRQYTNAGKGVASAMLIDYTSNYKDTLPLGGGANGISYKVTSAPHPLSKFGTMVASGLEVIMRTDMYDTMNVKLIGDLGAQETSTQTTNGNASNVSKVFVDEGIESNIVQYEISGTSTISIVGLEIYATNLWLTPSTGVAR